MQPQYALFAALSLILLPAAVQAQDKFEGGPTKGARTTSVSGTGIYTAKDNYNATVRLELGYYASSALEYSGVIAINGQSSPAQQVSVVGSNSSAFQSSSSSSGVALGGAVRYHFGHTRIIPYVGIAPQYDVINLTGHKSRQLIVVGLVGSDFFIKPQESIFAELALEKFTKDGSSTARLDIGVKLFY